MAVDLMWSLVGEGGCLALVEDGTPEGSRIVRSARKMLLEGEPSITTRAACSSKEGSLCLGLECLEGRTLTPTQLTPIHIHVVVVHF
jgi:hypothetical protein